MFHSTEANSGDTSLETTLALLQTAAAETEEDSDVSFN
jgi:hypothetical protein